MKSYLVVAHYDGDLEPVKQFIATTAQSEADSTFYVAVPATPPQNDGWAWTEKEAYDVAKRRLDTTMGALAGSSPNLTGDVVNYDTVAAIDESLQKSSYDELIIATPPDTVARTPFSQVEQHVRMFTKIPINHIVVENAKPIERA